MGNGTPVFTVQPATQRAEVGANVHFSALAAGVQPLNYQWYFNQTNALGEATNAIMTILDVQCAHAGSYSTVVSNSYGTVTSQLATLFVVPPVVAYEGFDYEPVGSVPAGQNGGIGFNGGWSGDSGYVTAGDRLDFPMAAFGNSLRGGGGDITRTLVSPLGVPGTTRNLSFLLRPDGPQGPDTYYFGLKLDAPTRERSPFIGKPSGGGSGTDRYVIENAGATGPVASTNLVVEGETVLLVVKAEFTEGLDRFTLHVNPTPGAAEPLSDTIKNDTDVGLINSLF